MYINFILVGVQPEGCAHQAHHHQFLEKVQQAHAGKACHLS